MTLQHYIIISSLVLCYPLSHFLFKKAMILDSNLTHDRHKFLGCFFFIPYINITVMLLYLMWVLIKLKKID